MKFLWTLHIIIPVCLLTNKVVGESFTDCIDCLDVLPEITTCLLANADTCDLADCTGDPPDFEACGCAVCVMPWISCLVDCIPDCLDKVIGEFVGCLLEPDNDCFDECSYYQGMNDSITIPILTPPKDCSLLSLLEDWRNCLPEFPGCDTVQDTIIPITCDALCCSNCESKLSNIESCIYNWISGRDCSFTCSDRRSLTDSTISRKLENNTDEPEFVQECRTKLVSDLVLNPAGAFNDFVDCIMSDSMELAADEANRPVTEKSDNSGGASGPLMMAFYVSIVAVLFN